MSTSEIAKIIEESSVSRVRVVGIVATDIEGGIGIGNTLPKFPKIDMKWFRQNTINKVCIVGRKTYESMPPLKDRHFFIITKDPVTYSDNNDLPSNVSVVSSLESAIKYAKMHAWENRQTEVMLIGGKTIYDQAVELGLVDDMLITKVHDNYDCNINISSTIHKLDRSYVRRTIYNGRCDDTNVPYIINHYRK